MSGSSSADKVMVEVVASGELAEAMAEGVVAGLHADAVATGGADAVSDAAEFDNESVSNNDRDDARALDVPAPKFRKLSCSEPAPSVQVSWAVVLLCGGCSSWWRRQGPQSDLAVFSTAPLRLRMLHSPCSLLPAALAGLALPLPCLAFACPCSSPLRPAQPPLPSAAVRAQCGQGACARLARGHHTPISFMPLPCSGPSHPHLAVCSHPRAAGRPGGTWHHLPAHHWRHCKRTCRRGHRGGGLLSPHHCR